MKRNPHNNHHHSLGIASSTPHFQRLQLQAKMLQLNPGYTMFPPAQQIIRNNMIANTLKISYKDSSVFWNAQIDLSKLRAPLKDLVELGENFVEVYPEDESDNEQITMEIQNTNSESNPRKGCPQKPPVGEQLNRRCLAEFKAGQFVNKNKMAEICQSKGCNLLTLERLSKSSYLFVVEIPHFTRYNFSINNEPDQESEQSHGQEKIDPQSILEVLKQKYLDCMIQEKQISLEYKQREIYRTELGKYIQKLSKDMNKKEQKDKKSEFQSATPQLTLFPNSPTQQHVQQIIRQNTEQRCHMIPYLPNSQGQYHFYTNGASSCSHLFPYQTEYLFFQNYCPKNNYFNSKKERPQIAYLNNVFLLKKNPSKMTNYILNEGLPIRIRQILAFYTLCFRPYNCQFRFTRFEGKLIIKQSHKKEESPENNIQLLKDCLQWIISSANQKIELPTNRYFNRLSVRKNAELAEEALKFKRYDEAEFLSCIQDLYYRNGSVPQNLGEELKMLSEGQFLKTEGHNKLIQQIDKYHWLIKLCIVAWYQPHDLFGSDPSIRSQLLRTSQCPHYGIQLQIIKQYLDPSYRINTHNLSFQSKNNQQLIWQWYFSQLLLRNSVNSQHYIYMMINKVCEYIYEIAGDFHELFEMITSILSLSDNLPESSRYCIIKKLVIRIIQMYYSESICNFKKINTFLSFIKEMPIYGHVAYSEAVLEYIRCLITASDNFETNIEILHQIGQIIQRGQQKMKINGVLNQMDMILHRTSMLVGSSVKQARIILPILTKIQQKVRSLGKQYETIENIINQYQVFMRLKANQLANGLSIPEIETLLDFGHSFQDNGIQHYILQTVYSAIIPHSQNQKLNIVCNYKPNQKYSKILDRMMKVYGQDAGKKMQLMLIKINQ